ncbi:MAG TPA: hypothetical protein VKH62_15630, partial [Candidatus Binatia bacterium]|nr:hypothetical protein [Candidatus Binatia bacterium]
QLGQKQELLDARDAELHGLTAKINELTENLSESAAERERANRLLQEELREKTALLQSKDSTIDDLETRFAARADSLERQIAEKQKLLEASGAEMGGLRAQMNAMEERLSESEAVNGQLEALLQQERSKSETQAETARAAYDDNSDETVNGDGRGVDTLLSEREELLKARDKLIQNLMTELKDKKTQLARQEIEVWKGIERREAWKHRLSKFGIRLKD